MKIEVEIEKIQKDGGFVTAEVVFSSKDFNKNIKFITKSPITEPAIKAIAIHRFLTKHKGLASFSDFNFHS